MTVVTVLTVMTVVTVVTVVAVVTVVTVVTLVSVVAIVTKKLFSPDNFFLSIFFTFKFFHQKKLKNSNCEKVQKLKW